MMATQLRRATQLTQPTSEPITIEEAKSQLSIAASDSYHDDRLMRYIRAARSQWEADTDSIVMHRTLRYYADALGESLKLPHRPIQSITSVVIRDSSSTTQIVATSTYSLDTVNGIIHRNYGTEWPNIIHHWDAVAITYVAGYADATLVPDDAKQAMLLLVAHYFENPDMMISNVYSGMAAYENLVKKHMRSTYP